MKIRRSLAAALTLLALVLLPLPAPAQRSNLTSQRWVGTWAMSPSSTANNSTIPASAYNGTNSFTNQTVRLITHISAGGGVVRVRLSNVFGTQALAIGAVHVAVRDTAANTVAGTDRQLLFSGITTVTIPPGTDLVSDPVAFAAPAGGDLAVSIYLPNNNTMVATVHQLHTQDTYVSTTNGGDASAATTFPLDAAMPADQEWPILTGVDVYVPGATKSVVAFGDSITDGYQSTVNANHRWPDFLSQRLISAGKAVSVTDQGISGNKVLVDQSGPSGLARFQRDAVVVGNADYIIVLLGINDVNGGSSGPAIIAGQRQFIARAHAAGIKIYGATLTPAGLTAGSSSETARTAVNTFIRSGGEYDGVIDFDVATRDPSNPTFFLPAYDSGDHLHPNDTGYQAMANAVDLSLFQ